MNFVRLTGFKIKKEKNSLILLGVLPIFQGKMKKNICQMTDSILLQIVNKIVIRQENMRDKK